MIQEEKSLLLKDLCVRLPYGFIVHRYSDNVDIEINDINTFSHFLEYSEDEDFKPYLRPMSSMTEEEERELRILWNEDLIGERSPFYIYPCYSKTLDFYNSHHFDYRGLIEKGLAIEAQEVMYKNK